MFKVGDRVKYIGGSTIIGSVLAKNQAYEVVALDVAVGEQMLVIKGFDDVMGYGFYSFNVQFFVLEKGIDYLAITRQFG